MNLKHPEKEMMMKPISRFIVSGITLAAVTNAALAQTSAPPPLPGPVTYVTLAEYNQLLQEGKIFPVDPAVLANQAARAEAAYKDNLEYVQDYLDKHPDDTALAAIVDTVPYTAAGNPNGMFEWPDGDYQIPFTDKKGQKSSLQMLGQRDKIAAIARSIQYASDPKVQLAVYTELYNRLPQAYLDSDAGKDTIHPSQLEGASLATIQSVIKSVTNHAQQIVQSIPFPAKLPVTGCAAEIGAGDAPQTTWGDRTSSAGCTKPSATGILANFDFPGKSQLTCVKQQGQRGTCHIFAATSAVEERVAFDTGKKVNLSEQDFMEHEKLLWGPAWFNDGGDGGTDLANALANNYEFAYEDQWDYNPANLQPDNPKVFEYQNTCGNGYPSSEPGCSESAPEAPGVCVTDMPICALYPAPVSGHSHDSDPVPLPIPLVSADWSITLGMMQIFLSADSPVIMGFTATHNFEYGSPGGYIEYNTSDLYNKKTILGGHVVHIAGYIDNAELAKKVPGATPGAGGGYFIIKNSWGACFGDAGYVYMPVAYMEAEAWDLWTLPAMVD
jgi:C1A family cysteine protease